MINNYFKDYKEFQEVFGTPKNRSNSIFLQTYKHFIRTGRKREFELAFPIVNVRNLCTHMETTLRRNPKGLNGQIHLLKQFYPTERFELDENGGVCEDLDVGAVRYLNDKGRVYKMKTGKFMRSILKENGIIEMYGEVLSNYYIEQFGISWREYTSKLDVRLVLDEDFDFIYSSRNYASGSMGSCMTDEDRSEFWNNAVSAMAASIVNNDGLILARCVVWTNVYNSDTGEQIRYADRQYSVDGEESYKRRLVRMLIDAGEIDAYKEFGAGVSDTRAIVDIHGESMAHCALTVDMNLDSGDVVSYMDTFRYYDINSRTSSNFDDDYTHELDSTNTYFEGGRNYDEYNDEYTDDEIVHLYVYSSWNGYYYDSTVAEGYAEDNFVWVDRLYGWATDAYYSELMDEHLPMDEYEDIEERWKEDNWNYDEYNEEYTPDNVITCFVRNRRYHVYDTMYVSEDFAYNNFIEYDGEYYNAINDETGIPYGIEAEELETV